MEVGPINDGYDLSVWEKVVRWRGQTSSRLIAGEAILGRRPAVRCHCWVALALDLCFIMRLIVL